MFAFIQLSLKHLNKYKYKYIYVFKNCIFEKYHHVFTSRYQSIIKVIFVDIEMYQYIKMYENT